MEQKLEFKRKKNVTLLTDGDIKERLLRFFKRHIGRENGALRGELFRHVWGSFDNYRPEEIWWLDHRIKQNLNHLRKISNMFVVVDADSDNRRYYYVVKKHGDEKYYIDLLNNTIKKIRWMKARCREAIRNEDYKKYLDGNEYRKRKEER